MTPTPQPRLTDPGDIRQRLLEAGYLADELIADAVFLAGNLGKPLLVEGPAGVGKTELAKATAALTGSRLLRLQCYEGLDEAKALYEWNYKKQLLRIQAGAGGREAGKGSWAEAEADIFTEDFLLERPLLAAIRATDPVLLLIDEVDRVEVETEALLLEVLSDFQVSIPELGTVTSRRRPLVVLTSNATRELSEALRRRCLYLHIDYPDTERERRIIELRVPGIRPDLAAQAARVVHTLRGLDLTKPPSISETVDWARSLMLLGIEDLDSPAVARALPALVKNHKDGERAAAGLGWLCPGGYPCWLCLLTVAVRGHRCPYHMRVKYAGVTHVWRVVLVAAGVTGLVLGWGPPSDMTAPLVFFTDQSNMVVAAYFAFAVLFAAAVALRPGITGRGPGRRLAAARDAAWLRGAVTLYIIITGLVYHVVLATDKNPLSLLSSSVSQPAGIGTFLLHYVVPLMALADFLLAERGGAYRWRYAAFWLCYPLAYLAFALIRGAYFTVGSYPYPFLNVTEHGYRGVALNVVEYTALFYLLGTVVVALARLVRRRREATAVAASPAAASRESA